MRVRAERHHADEMLKASRPSSIKTHMVKPRAVADRYHQGIMDLIGFRAIGGDIAFHQRRACAPCRS